MINKKIIKIIEKIGLTALVLYLTCVIGFVGFIFISSYVDSWEALRVLGYAFLVLLLYIIFLIWSTELRSEVKKIFIVLECIAALGFVFFSVTDAYHRSIPTVSDNFSLFEYEAYSGQRVATLNEPSELNLKDDLPVIDCATALYPVASAFVQAAYPENNYPRMIWSVDDGIPVYCSGTSSAYDRLVEGEVDIIFVAGPSEEQLEYAKEAGVEFIMTPIGKEAFVFFVNNKNPVSNLTVEQVQQIYSGQITNWSSVGGNNSKIRAFQRNKNSGSQTALEKFMQGKELMAAPKEDVVSVMDGIVEVVSDYKNYEDAIGFSFRFYSTEMVNNDEIHLLSLNGVAPDKDSVRDGTYPISSEFYAVTTASSNANVEPLIEWILSPQGQFLIEETGYVGINMLENSKRQGGKVVENCTLSFVVCSCNLSRYMIT